MDSSASPARLCQARDRGVSVTARPEPSQQRMRLMGLGEGSTRSCAERFGHRPLRRRSLTRRGAHHRDVQRWPKRESGRWVRGFAPTCDRRVRPPRDPRAAVQGACPWSERWYTAREQRRPIPCWRPHTKCVPFSPVKTVEPNAPGSGASSMRRCQRLLQCRRSAPPARHCQARRWPRVNRTTYRSSVYRFLELRVSSGTTSYFSRTIPLFS
jgi:hypothetical protein